MSGITATGIVAHVPTLSRAEITPEFQNTLVEGERRLGERLRALKPDLWVVVSTHWVSTFNWFATLQVNHEGICVADEAPDLIPLPILQGWIFWLALGVMLLVGVSSGLIPAWRATQVDPAETLRCE